MDSTELPRYRTRRMDLVDLVESRTILNEDSLAERMVLVDWDMLENLHDDLRQDGLVSGPFKKRDKNGRCKRFRCVE